MLPRIHEQLIDPPGRPMVFGSGGPIEKISQVVDHFINPLVSHTKSFVWDSTHMIYILLDSNNLFPDAILCTLDVSTFYTKITHSEGIQAISEFLAVHGGPVVLPYKSYVIDLPELVLKNNYFEFDGK